MPEISTTQLVGRPKKYLSMTSKQTINIIKMRRIPAKIDMVSRMRSKILVTLGTDLMLNSGLLRSHV